MPSNIYFITVFLEGLASFLSPCVLPMIPVYLTYLTGQSIEDIASRKSHKRLIVNAIAFVLGFSIVFVALGAAATSIGRFLGRYQYTIKRVSGILIIVFGLFHAGFLNIAFMQRERRRQMKVSAAPSFITSTLIGMGFSIGWTPCIGPILTSVLLMASNAETLVAGMGLLSIYALGLGVPFILMAILMGTMYSRFQNLYKYMDWIKKISGILLVAIGILILLNKM